MQPPGGRSQRGIACHRSAAGMHVAAHGAVPLCLRVQREVPHHHSQPHLLLPVWQLHWQQPAGQDRAGVRFTPAVAVTFFSFTTHRHVVTPTTDADLFCLSCPDCLVISPQTAREDSLFVELSLGKSDRLHQPSVPAWTQSDTGAPPAIYCPLLF